MTDDEELTPARLAARRRALGLSQVAAARALGVHHITIANWERGTTRIERPLLLHLALCELERRAGVGGDDAAGHGVC